MGAASRPPPFLILPILKRAIASSFQAAIARSSRWIKSTEIHLASMWPGIEPTAPGSKIRLMGDVCSLDKR